MKKGYFWETETASILGDQLVPPTPTKIRGALESKGDKGHIFINNLNFAPKLVSNERSILGVLLLIDVGFDFVIGEVDKYCFKVKFDPYGIF